MSETVPQVDTVQVVLDVLKQAAAAHGVHEAEVLGGRYDEEWPQWYAEHIASTLADSGYTIVRTAS
ncbi:hypothetical protein ACFFGH_32915 [Lysobacter korlensis]|uniref:Integron gene cassette protein n=1 Tax=Lysobacter korlensis TaxID=553636 RepID=A0ABV6S0A1_9GAMM